ncbi:hypothetical protein AB1Y20_010001 [Prymnesium parvum]|uniref:EGF-like domain-containing protein n=1 Tax=Prymnesium parvum TaxID=97485 RepID=A0AB34K3S7_PRYPA
MSVSACILRRALFALLLSTTRAVAPTIFNLYPFDADDSQRGVDNGDVLVIEFAPRGRSVANWQQPLSKAGVDAILSFSAALGAGYVGAWTFVGGVLQLTVTITDATGAARAQLEALNFTVACVPDRLYFASQPEPCTSEGVAPFSGANWGAGRPRLVAVNSSSPRPAALLGANDTVTLTFDADVDTAAAAGTPAALFTLPSALGSELRGLWLDNRTYEITLLAPPSGALRGDDFSVACAAGAPLRLLLPADATPPSETCCAVGGTCVPVAASGSFGSLPPGPQIAAALADDPDDADAAPGRLSVGDTIRLTFSAPSTSPANSNPADMFTFVAGGFELPLGTFSGEWISSTQYLLTLLASTPAVPPDISALSVRCRSGNGITLVPLGSSRECNASLTTALAGDFGALPPRLASAIADDPDDSDAVFGPGDTLDITFTAATDRAGYALGAVLNSSEVYRLFEFKPLEDGIAELEAVWLSATALRIQIISVAGYPLPVAPYNVSCRCPAGREVTASSGRNCRDPNGIHLADAVESAAVVPLSCSHSEPASIASSLSSNWGRREGPRLVSVIASDEDNGDAVYSDGDSFTLVFDQPTDGGGVAVGTVLNRSQVDARFNFVSTLGADYSGVWSTNSTFTITILDSTGHSMSSSNRNFLLTCRQPILDAARLFLPSTCDSYGSQFVGDFGVLLSPVLASAVAADEDSLDGILSVGDTITMTWTRPTDISVQGGAGCPASPSASLRSLVGDALYAMVQLRRGAAAVDAQYDGTWLDCSTLRLNITVAPSTPLLLTDEPLLELKSTGGRSGQGVRDPTSQSFAGSGVVRITGSFGELEGPRLVSAVADDPDDGDAIFSDGDTLTLTFDQPTDLAGAVVGARLNSSWLQRLLVAPSHGSSYSGVWTDPSTLVITMDDTSGADADGWLYNASVSLSTQRKLLNAQRTSLAANGSTTAVSGDWGTLQGPAVVGLIAAGSAADAIYGAGDQISLLFGVPTNTGGLSVGANFSYAEVQRLVECGFDERLVLPEGGWVEQFRAVSLGANLTGMWEDNRTLVLTVVDSQGADDGLVVVPLSGKVGAAIGELRCCARPSAAIRNLEGTSLPASSCSPPLGGSWGSKRGPRISEVLLHDPTGLGTSLGAGDVITLRFLEPTDMSALPAGWALTDAALRAAVTWDPPLYSSAQGRWADPTALQIVIVEPYGGATTSCPTTTVSINASLAVRDALRTSLPSDASATLFPYNCLPGNGTALYSFGSLATNALGLGDDPSVCSSNQLAVGDPQPIGALAGSVVTGIAAGERFSVVSLLSGNVYTWGSRFPLGLETSPETLTTPRLLPFPSAATAVAAGWEHALVLLGSGAVYGFGYDSFGQLGAGRAAGGRVRDSIDGLPPARLIGAGALHSFVVSRDGSQLWGFGSNDAGQLYPSSEPQLAVPQLLSFSGMPPAASIVSITGGRFHTVALTRSGEVCCWGSNSHGQLGPASRQGTACFNVSDAFGQPVRAVAIAAGDEHSLAIAANGEVYAWGRGDAAAAAVRDVAVPVRPLARTAGAEGAFFLSIAAGRAHSVATTAGGAVWTWGENGMGQLGQGCASTGRGSLNASSVPTAAASFEYWREVRGVYPTHTEALNLSVGSAALVGTIGGAAAPCRAACEADGGCGGFSLAAAGECRFWRRWAYAPPAAWARGGALRTVADEAWTLHLLAAVARGGAALGGAGVEHSLLAAELTQPARCPSDFDGAVCGGSARGACVGGACVCEREWRGEGCALQACEPSCHSEHGECRVEGDALRCVCAAGWSGASCDQPVCEKYGGVNCAGHGACVLQPGGGRACACNYGWQGEACELPLCLSDELNRCSNRGWCGCSSGDGSPPAQACADVPGGRNYTAVCTCSAAWGGADCTLPCPLYQGLPCGGNGVCLEVVAPKRNWTARSPALPPSPPPAMQCACDPLFEGEACEVALCPGAPRECGGPLQGECVTSASGARVCSCYEGFGGVTCSVFSCQGGCSGRGSCVVGLGSTKPSCICDDGWEGPDCSTSVGVQTLIYSLAIGGGALGGLLILGALAWLVRLLSAGTMQTPGTAFQQHRWKTAHAVSFDGSAAVWYPSRHTNNQGYRSRITPRA